MAWPGMEHLGWIRARCRYSNQPVDHFPLQTVKIPHLYRQRQAGLALLGAILLFVLFIAFIGTLAYLIWRAIQGLPQRPDPDHEVAIIEFATQQEILRLTAANPGNPITVSVAAVLYAPNRRLFVPFGPYPVQTQIERSIDLRAWQVVATVPPNEVWYDLDLMDKAFYRRFDAQGQPTLCDTNCPPAFIYQ